VNTFILWGDYHCCRSCKCSRL